MNILNENNLGAILEEWFKKTIYDISKLSFNEKSLYKDVLLIFIFDYKRYFPNDIEIYTEKVINTLPLQGILTYRIAHLYFLKKDEKTALLYSNLGRFLSGIEIYYSALIGKGLKINHGLATVIGARCILGENILLHQSITLGDKNGERPIIEDNVIIYAGAVIIGGIRVGKNAIIGANSVIFKDVPANKKAVGIPGKII